MNIFALNMYVVWCQELLAKIDGKYVSYLNLFLVTNESMFYRNDAKSGFLQKLNLSLIVPS